MKKQKSGISLIVLVITIIVIIILAVAVILSIANNNPIENANKAKFQNDLKTIAEELTLKQASNYIDEHTGNTVTAITIDSLSSAENYQTKLLINNQKLWYVKGGVTEKEAEWAEEVGLESAGTLLKNGENGLTISDAGELAGEYEGSETDIIIPSTVTKLAGNGCFLNCSNLKSVYLPESIESIYYGTFEGCSNLETINLPSKLKSIGRSAFLNCSALKSIIIPNGVESIGDGAFLRKRTYKYNNTF